ncbi:arginine decarboxylase 2-like [Ananas comosus]|uniref:Arginine decarboxylase n=1 Tax=Ananas comosus TaxID=4615 RepID=A0A6P5EVS7_ANACO|nr:arginine decarboxylase 2-like [Ananas comosus]
MSTNYGYLYNIEGWGDPYFAVNSSGNISVKTNGVETTSEQEIDLLAAVKAATAKNLQFPLILRFPDVLKHRLDSLYTAFINAIQYTGYNSHYQGVFPVKVNQNKDVVDNLVNFGKGHVVKFGEDHYYNFGLEAGSKPELLLAMHSLINGSPEAYLVCNGYKDMDYISLALVARTIKLNTIIVLELEDEVDTVVAASKKLNIRPVLGIRARLLTTNPGHFGSTSGKHGKFGLLEAQIYAVAKKLEQLGMLDCLKLLHFHIGSQIPTTSILSSAVREASGYYCNLVKMGAPMGTLDIGGGLGIDYDGTRSGSSDMSVAYGFEEYASAVVQAAKLVCNQNGVQHPVLCSESGRALASHHSILIYDALSVVEDPSDSVSSDELISRLDELVGNPTKLHANLKSAVRSRDSNNNTSRAHADQLKKHGVEIFKLSRRLAKQLEAAGETTYSYHANLSVFSLTPDFWGIKQLFPILPIHRLNEQPTQKGTLIDLTCDSDGKIDQFIGEALTLPLHALEQSGGGYYIGTFLAGAYQEPLGCKHNLFGGPTLVRVDSTAGSSGGFTVELLATGPSAADQLKAMHHDPDEIMNDIAKQGAEADDWTENIVKKVLGDMPYLFGAA